VYRWGESNGLAVYRDRNDLEDRHYSNHENAKGKMMQTVLQIPMETLGASGFMGIFSPYPGVGLEDQSSLYGFREDGIIAWIVAARCRGSFKCHKLSVHRLRGDTDLYDRTSAEKLRRYHRSSSEFFECMELDLWRYPAVEVRIDISRRITILFALWRFGNFPFKSLTQGILEGERKLTLFLFAENSRRLGPSRSTPS